MSRRDDKQPKAGLVLDYSFEITEIGGRFADELSSQKIFSRVGGRGSGVVSLLLVLSLFRDTLGNDTDGRVMQPKEVLDFR